MCITFISVQPCFLFSQQYLDSNSILFNTAFVTFHDNQSNEYVISAELLYCDDVDETDILISQLFYSTIPILHEVTHVTLSFPVKRHTLYHKDIVKGLSRDVLDAFNTNNVSKILQKIQSDGEYLTTDKSLTGMNLSTSSSYNNNTDNAATNASKMPQQNPICTCVYSFHPVCIDDTLQQTKPTTPAITTAKTITITPAKIEYISSVMPYDLSNEYLPTIFSRLLRRLIFQQNTLVPIMNNRQTYLYMIQKYDSQTADITQECLVCQRMRQISILYALQKQEKQEKQEIQATQMKNSKNSHSADFDIDDDDDVDGIDDDVNYFDIDDGLCDEDENEDENGDDNEDEDECGEKGDDTLGLSEVTRDTCSTKNTKDFGSKDKMQICLEGYFDSGIPYTPCFTLPTHRTLLNTLQEPINQNPVSASSLLLTNPLERIKISTTPLYLHKIPKSSILSRETDQSESITLASTESQTPHQTCQISQLSPASSTPPTSPTSRIYTTYTTEVLSYFNRLSHRNNLTQKKIKLESTLQKLLSIPLDAYRSKMIVHEKKIRGEIQKIEKMQKLADSTSRKQFQVSTCGDILDFLTHQFQIPLKTRFKIIATQTKTDDASSMLDISSTSNTSNISKVEHQLQPQSRSSTIPALGNVKNDFQSNSLSNSLLLPSLLVVGEEGLGKSTILQQISHYSYLIEKHARITSYYQHHLSGTELLHAIQKDLSQTQGEYGSKNNPNNQNALQFSIGNSLAEMINSHLHIDSIPDLLHPIVSNFATTSALFEKWRCNIFQDVLNTINRQKRCNKDAEIASNPIIAGFCFIIDDIDKVLSSTLISSSSQIQTDSIDGNQRASNPTTLLYNFLTQLPTFFMTLNEMFNEVGKSQTNQIALTPIGQSFECRYSIIASTTLKSSVNPQYTTNGLFIKTTQISYPLQYDRMLLFLEYFRIFTQSYVQDTNKSQSATLRVALQDVSLVDETYLREMMTTTHQGKMIDIPYGYKMKQYLQPDWLQNENNQQFLCQSILPFPGLFTLCMSLAERTSGQNSSSLYRLFTTIVDTSQFFSTLPKLSHDSTVLCDESLDHINDDRNDDTRGTVITLEVPELVLVQHNKYFEIMSSKKGISQSIPMSNSTKSSSSLSSTASSLIMTSPLDHFAGYFELKTELRSLMDQWKRPNSQSNLGISPPSGILFCGPSGVGKTYICRQFSQETGFPVLSLSCADVLQRYLGESERVIRSIFSRARLLAPVIVFIDQLETIAPNRGIKSASSSTGVESRVLSTLLNELDGVEERKGVYVIATSRDKQFIDAALLRPGRLDRIVNIDSPDIASKEAIFTYYTNYFNVKFDINTVDEKGIGVFAKEQDSGKVTTADAEVESYRSNRVFNKCNSMILNIDNITASQIKMVCQMAQKYAKRDAERNTKYLIKEAKNLLRMHTKGIKSDIDIGIGVDIDIDGDSNTISTSDSTQESIVAINNVDDFTNDLLSHIEGNVINTEEIDHRSLTKFAKYIHKVLKRSSSTIESDFIPGNYPTEDINTTIAKIMQCYNSLESVIKDNSKSSLLTYVIESLKNHTVYVNAFHFQQAIQDYRATTA